MVYDFNYFRALAIVVIVAGHVMIFTNYGGDFFSDFIRDLFSGGTALFVFISGFMFKHVFLRNFNYLYFLKKKIFQLVPPYLILSSLPILLSLMQPRELSGGYYLPSGEGLFEYYIIPALKYLYTGGGMIAYWYIPFAMVIFIISPFFLWYSRSSMPVMIILFMFFLVISFFMHRPLYNMPLWQSVIYYFPFYMFGILSAKYRRDLNFNILVVSLLFVVAFAIILLNYYIVSLGHVGNYVKPPFKYEGGDFQLIKILLVIIFTYTFLQALNLSRDSGVWKMLKDYSFSIFFLHGYALEFASRLGFISLVENTHANLIIITIYSLFFSILMTKIVEFILPKYSKYIVAK